MSSWLPVRLPPSGLREQKKQLTRQAIAQTTPVSRSNRGLEDVTVEAIAHRVRLTAHGNELLLAQGEAIAAAGSLTPEDVIQLLTERPRDEEPLQSLCRSRSTLSEPNVGPAREHHRQKPELVYRYRTVPYLAARYRALQERLASELATRTGRDADSDICPRLLAAAVVASLRLSLARWAASNRGVEELVTTVRSAFASLQRGLPSPRAAVLSRWTTDPFAAGRRALGNNKSGRLVSCVAN